MSRQTILSYAARRTRIAAWGLSESSAAVSSSRGAKLEYAYVRSHISESDPGLGQVDPIWHSIRAEAEEAAKNDPVLGTFLYATILNQPSLEDAVMHRIAERLGHADLSADILRQTFDAMLDANPEWSQIVRVDIQAVYDRDPAYSRFMDPILYLKGFHAIQTHRLAHWLYHEGRKDFAYYLQSRSSSIFQTDIHPAASFGSGLFLIMRPDLWSAKQR